LKAERDAWIVDSIVRSRLDSVEASLAREASAFSAPAGLFAQLRSPKSKRLRPAFVLLAGAMGPRPRVAETIAAATAVELVHEGTLYHDDIVDGAIVRRGQRTAVAAHGARAAAAAGGVLLYRGMEMVLDLPAPVRIAMAQTAATMARAVVRETETAGDVNLSVTRRLTIMWGKTAALFALAAHTGAVVSELPEHEARALGRFATRFAMAFQLADDLYDLANIATLDGSKPGVDLKTGVYTLPVLLALREAPATSDDGARLREQLWRLNAGPDQRAERRIAELVHAAGGSELGRVLVLRWSASARAALEEINWQGQRDIRASFLGLLDTLDGLDNTLQMPAALRAVGDAQPLGGIIQ
jgi:heptaprenyl diphosphate synthase